MILLLIMDGYGLNPDREGNAIALSSKPNLDGIFSEYKRTSLGASGLDVGLPEGQMGNSEVGHLNFGDEGTSQDMKYFFYVFQKVFDD